MGSVMQTLQKKFGAASTAVGQNASTANTGYVQRASEFDAGAAFEKATTGAHQRHMTDLSKALERLRGQQAGMGRMNTGYATMDEDDTMVDMNDNFNSAMAGYALNANQQNLSNIQGMGQYGAQMAGVYGDMLSGDMDREQAKINRRRDKRSSLLGGALGLAGAAAGTYLLPGIGTELGAKLGGYIGQGLGG